MIMGSDPFIFYQHSFPLLIYQIKANPKNLEHQSKIIYIIFYKGDHGVKFCKFFKHLSLFSHFFIFEIEGLRNWQRLCNTCAFNDHIVKFSTFRNLGNMFDQIFSKRMYYEIVTLMYSKCNH